MGEANMDTEDILAEPDEIQQNYLGLAINTLHAYGWYIILAGLGIFFYFKTRITSGASSGAASARSKSPQELEAWQLKEEQRLKAVERLQAKYAQEAAIKAEHQKKLDEEKRKARLEEKQKLAGLLDEGHKLGEGDGKKGLRPEYNPLMGDSGSSGRVCFRRPGGGGG